MLTPNVDVELHLSVLGNYAEVVGPPSPVSTVHSALLSSGFAKSVTFSRGYATGPRASFRSRCGYTAVAEHAK